MDKFYKYMTAIGLPLLLAGITAWTSIHTNNLQAKAEVEKGELVMELFKHMECSPKIVIRKK